MKDPELFTLPCRVGNSKPFDTLADLGSCENIILLYLFKKLNIGLLEETGHIFGLADGTKSNPIGILKDVEVHIGKLKLLNDFYVIDMKKDPETPLLVGRGFLATANAVIDCRKAKIAVGEGITRLVFGVKGVDLDHCFVGYPFDYRVTLGFGSIAGVIDHVNPVIRLPLEHGISRVLGTLSERVNNLYRTGTDIQKESQKRPNQARDGKDQIYEPEVKGTSSSSTNRQNVAFVSSNSTNSTNGAANTTHGATTASTQASAVNSTIIDNLSDAVANGYANNKGKEILKEHWKEIFYEWAPKNQENRNKENTRSVPSVEARLLMYKKNESVYEEDIKVSDSEEEEVPQAKKEKKTVKSSFAKIEFVKSKEQLKSPRKTVNHVNQIRKNTHTPRGNQRN
ncbi:MAK10-like protein [Tanacetum coccineum]